MDADDDSYMCDVDGMLQWHAQIKYGAADSLASGTTPAVMAAHANDYVAYSGAEFKTILAGYINDEVSRGSRLLIDSTVMMYDRKNQHCYCRIQLLTARASYGSDACVRFKGKQSVPERPAVSPEQISQKSEATMLCCIMGGTHPS